ncbi:uncharacterized protein TNCV_174521 [Trichonephila clavipes]|nr:uncharacterized protein TNCV_174521 [Trichonephila clavipes]
MFPIESQIAKVQKDIKINSYSEVNKSARPIFSIADLDLRFLLSQLQSLRKKIGHLKEKFYVDNSVTSVNDVTELEQLKSQSIEIMNEGAFELHCWASNDSKEDQDASAYAYATCAFLRYEFKGQVTVKRIAAKARLSPMKNPQSHNLNLLEAALGPRLAENVPGEVNPADLATRCCDWSDLLKSKWWESPGWLYSDEESWLCSDVSETLDEAFEERRKTVVTNLATGNEVRFEDRFLYFSSYKKILRMTAYVLRFCKDIKRNSLLS